VIFGGGEVQADDVASQIARLAAHQRIRADAASALKPPALSHDGRLIAFVARDPDSLERPCCLNVYVLDTLTGRITQESVRPDGTPFRGDSQTPSLSSDGRVLAFETMASNLPSGEATRVGPHIIVRERQDGAFRTPLSVSGDIPDGLTSGPVVSGDGGAVAFTSDASNLTPGQDANGRQTDVYLWRLDSSTVTRLSVDSRGIQPASGASHSPSLSRDGELVAFVSTARLVPDDTNNLADVYVRDVRRGVTSLVSRAVDGSPADGASHSPALSANGRYVAFASTAANLGPRDRNHEDDVYIHDVTTRTTTLVSATSKGEAVNAESRRPAISADGHYVVYQSTASNVGSGPGCPPPASDTNLLPDVYLFDRITLCATRISGSATQEWWTPSVAPAIDGSGSIIVFSTTQPVDDGEGTVDFDLFQRSATALTP
jgi:Tol biopolymer transport system component